MLNRDIHEGYYCREDMNRRRIPAGKAVGIKTDVHNSAAVRDILNRLQLLDKDKNPLVSEEHIIWPTRYENLDIAELDSYQFGFKVELEWAEFFQAPPPIDPHTKLASVMNNWIEENASSHGFDVSKNTPKKWEILGEVGLLSSDSFEPNFIRFLESVDESKLMELWDGLSASISVAKLGLQQHIANDKVRSSQVKLLNSDDGWTTFLDKGVKFTFDVTKVMFSSGNVTERHRIAEMNFTGQTIVDCYTGVGYYSLHAIKNANANHVHACELNPNSIIALKKALSLNNLEQKMTIYEGDNLDFLPKLNKIADRVFLGLLPSSESVWEDSIACLKDSGGFLHIHMNVEEEKIDAWVESTISKMLDYSCKQGRNFRAVSTHLEKVKWFSPYVRHVVLDLELRP